MQRRRVSLSEVKTYKNNSNVLLFLKCDVWASMCRTTFENFDIDLCGRDDIRRKVLEATSWNLMWKLRYFNSSGVWGSFFWRVFFWRVTCFYSLLRNAVNLSYVYKTDLAWWVSLADFTAVSSAAEKQKWVSGFGHFKTRKEKFMLKCWNEIWGAGLDLPHVELCKRNRRFARWLSTSSVFSMSTENTE